VTIWFTEVFTVKQINQFNKTTAMDLEEIRNRVKKVTAKVLEIDESELSDSANFSFDLGASSIQSILLVAAFQEEFNIEMDEEKSLEIQTISEAAEFISGYLD
jgi:acyl carrier protein